MVSRVRRRADAAQGVSSTLPFVDLVRAPSTLIGILPDYRTTACRKNRGSHASGGPVYRPARSSRVVVVVEIVDVATSKRQRVGSS